MNKAGLNEISKSYHFNELAIKGIASRINKTLTARGQAYQFREYRGWDTLLIERTSKNSYTLTARSGGVSLLSVYRKTFQSFFKLKEFLADEQGLPRAKDYASMLLYKL